MAASISGTVLMMPIIRCGLASSRLGLRIIPGQRAAEFFPVTGDFVGFPSTVEHVKLALDHLGNGVAGGAEVVAGVEFGWLRSEDFADFGGHGQSQIGVDVDLADAVIA